MMMIVPAHTLYSVPSHDPAHTHTHGCTGVGWEEEEEEGGSKRVAATTTSTILTILFPCIG